MNDFKLDTNPKIASGFSAPDDYFDNFSARLMGKLPAQEPKVISFYSRHKSWIYSAAAILVIAFTIPIMNLSQGNADVILNTEVENYITNRSTITDDDLVNLLDEEDIAKLKTETTIDGLTTEDVLSENSDIENYILN
jgi:hypothetical protein